MFSHVHPDWTFINKTFVFVLLKDPICHCMEWKCCLNLQSERSRILVFYIDIYHTSTPRVTHLSHHFNSLISFSIFLSNLSHLWLFLSVRILPRVLHFFPRLRERAANSNLFYKSPEYKLTPKLMSQIKITNSIFNICLGDARGKTQKKKPILITDSKGFSLQQEVSTEKFIDLLIISESKLSIYDTCFIWKALKSNLVKKAKPLFSSGWSHVILQQKPEST